MQKKPPSHARLRIVTLVFLLFSTLTQAENHAALRFILPPVLYAASGIESNVYFDNVVLVLNSADYAFDVTCTKGIQQEERWTFVPEPEDVGEHPFTLEVRDRENRVVATASTRLVVSPPAAGTGTTRSILMMGDSLTAASHYPARVAELAAGNDRPSLNFIGTRGPDTSRHEGYGGWTAERFATKYTGIARGGPYKECGSPFIYKEGDEEPRLDFTRYCEEFNSGNSPDFVTILLGCNDTFNATDETIEDAIDRMFRHYDTILQMIREAGPETRIGLLPPVPPAASQDAFGANYRTGQTRWQYRRNQHRVVERMLEKSSNREEENLFLVPAFTNLDSEHGFPNVSGPANAHSTTEVTRQNNGVHPSVEGYRQIGDSIFSWIESQSPAD